MKYSEYNSDQRRWFWIVNLISGSRFFTPFIIFLGFYPAVHNNNIAHAFVYIVIIGLLTAGDAIDGRLAGRHNVKSRLGDLLDHISDKCTLIAAVVAWGVLLYQADLAQYRTFILWTTGLVFGLTLVEEALVAYFNLNPSHWGTGANNDGRNKYTIQGVSLAIAGIGMTFYYGHPFALSFLTFAADSGFMIALYLGATSIVDYYQRDRALATK